MGIFWNYSHTHSPLNPCTLLLTKTAKLSSLLIKILLTKLRAHNLPHHNLKIPPYTMGPNSPKMCLRLFFVFFTFLCQTLYIHLHLGCCPNYFDMISHTKSQIMTSDMMSQINFLDIKFFILGKNVLFERTSQEEFNTKNRSLLPQKVLEL